MSYTPTEWENGDIITAERLNKMENGIAAGSLPTATYDIILDVGDTVTSTASNYEFIKFDLDNVKAKVLKGEVVTGVAIRHYNYDDLVAGDTDIILYSLRTIQITHDVGNMCFYDMHTVSSDNSSASVAATRISITFNITTGEITSVNAADYRKTIAWS